MGRADRQAPLALIAELCRERANTLRLFEDPERPLDHLLPGGRDAGEIASLADEDLEAELVLEQLDLLAHPRLRGMELVRGGGDVAPSLSHGREIAQLAQLHSSIRLSIGPGYRHCVDRA